MPVSSLLTFSMMILQVFLWICVGAFLFVHTHGYPTKGSKSQDQSSSDRDAGGNFAVRRGAASGRYSPVSYGVSRDVSGPVQGLGQGLGLSQPVLTDSAISSATPEAGYPFSVGSVVPTPAQAGYVSPIQTGAAQPGLPETKWAVEPKIFSEEGLANTQGSESGDFLQPVPQTGPVLQSGETSSLVKEAELGNYQHETEELGYPADHTGSGQGLASVPLSSFGGGTLGYPSTFYPYPDFDYRFLYGLYPPGTYSTFSNHHEKGKDYFQDLHFLMEHGSDSDLPNTYGSDQKKLFGSS